MFKTKTSWATNYFFISKNFDKINTEDFKILNSIFKKKSLCKNLNNAQTPYKFCEQIVQYKGNLTSKYTTWEVAATCECQ